MNWQVDWEPSAKKKFDKLDFNTKKQIINYINNRILVEPTKYGKPLLYDKFGFWRYRVGDYRIVCEIKKNIATIAIINVGHRKDIYN